MRKLRLGEANLGALVGAVVGAGGGLVAVAIPLAIANRDIHALSEFHQLGLVGFLISTPVGWFVGGQIGSLLERMLSERNAGIAGGIIGGLLPVAGFAFWGWYMITPK